MDPNDPIIAYEKRIDRQIEQQQIDMDRARERERFGSHPVPAGPPLFPPFLNPFFAVFGFIIFGAVFVALIRYFVWLLSTPGSTTWRGFIVGFVVLTLIGILVATCIFLYRLLTRTRLFAVLLLCAFAWFAYRAFVHGVSAKPAPAVITQTPPPQSQHHHKK